MARVEVFQGGRVNIQPGTDARQRAADFGPGALAAGLSAAGDGLGKVADKVDALEDVQATVEADRLDLQHLEVERALASQLRQAKGENAGPAAQQLTRDLRKQTDAILSKASPRARMKLAPTINRRLGEAAERFDTYGHGEMVKAFDANSAALINAEVEKLADNDDEAQVVTGLAKVDELVRKRGAFFGMGADQVQGEIERQRSQVYRSRALKLASGEAGSATSALEYAKQHRGALTDDDYNAILSSYSRTAMEEKAMLMTYGQDAPSNEVVVGVGDSGNRLDPKAYFRNWMTSPSAEGTAYAIDNNGYGVKFGFNQKSNPDIDVKSLTMDQASSRFANNHWKRAGAGDLPPALAAVHMDTFFLNERKAMQFLKDSGGDVNRYIELRRGFLNGLARANPAKYPGAVWERRTKALVEYANGLGAGQQIPGVAIGPDTDLSAYRDRIMRDPTIGLTMKTLMVGALEQRRGALQQERSIKERAAGDTLAEAALALGEKFTDPKQLPQGAWMAASVETRAALTNQAKGNLEGRDPSIEDLQYIEYVKVTNPEKFASRAFTQELMKRGVPLNKLREVAGEQGKVAGELVNKKVDTISSGALWAVAKPMFEASGVFLESIEENRTGAAGEKAKLAERMEDERRKLKAVGFLSDLHRRWALANPGKTADEATIRQWVGYALRQTRNGRGFELDDRQFYDRIPAAERQRAMQALMRVHPNWSKLPIDQRIADVVAMVRERAATGR